MSIAQIRARAYDLSSVAARRHRLAGDRLHLRFEPAGTIGRILTLTGLDQHTAAPEAPADPEP